MFNFQKRHIEIARTSVTKEVAKSQIKPEIIRKSALRKSMRQRSGVASVEVEGLLSTTTFHQVIDLSTKVHGAVGLGIIKHKTLDLGTTTHFIS